MGGGLEGGGLWSIFDVFSMFFGVFPLFVDVFLGVGWRAEDFGVFLIFVSMFFFPPRDGSHDSHDFSIKF